MTSRFRPFRRLSPGKLQDIIRRSRLDLDRAYWCGDGRIEGRVRPDSATCLHFLIDRETGDHLEIPRPRHWLSCPKGQYPPFSTDSS